VALSQKRLEGFYFSKINIPNHYPEAVNNLFKFSAQDSDLEYLFWRRKNSPVSSDLKPPTKSCLQLDVAITAGPL
jgi:hypothetical protein